MAKDPLLSKLKRYIRVGWPDTQLEKEFKPYRSRWKELSILNGCILWGSQVVIPPQGRKAVLEELHETHPGCSKMKALARSYIWWPKMDQEIESLVQKCSVCKKSRSSPPTAPLHPWQWPGQPCMEQTTSRLCRSIYETHVFSHCRCPLQMVGCSHHVINYICKNH